MGNLEQHLGGFVGSALLVVLIIFLLAWILLPIWVWNIRDNMKKHIQQQEEMLRLLRQRK